MDPLYLQKQLRDNSTDLQDYFKDIQSWGEEMKRKESALKNLGESSNDVPLPRNKLPKKEKKKADNEPSTSEVTEAPKTSTKLQKDFNYWEKFDVEAECEKVDTEKDKDDDSDLTDEFDEEATAAAVELALEEKEKGNKFVKGARWDDALKCYTKAIECYHYDATFYANRALCHLKLEQYKSAEADCTIALQLDNKYVKALHRRAIAKEAMRQYNEAKTDLERVLEIEPENKESQKLLDIIEKYLKPPKPLTERKEAVQAQRPVSMFTASRQKQPVASTSGRDIEDAGPAFRELIVERKNPTIKSGDVKDKVGTKSTSYVKINSAIQWPMGDAVQIVKSFNKPPKDRSRVSLKRMQVQECTLKSIKS